ncbi:hypothetical protein FHS01_003769 [Longimicrobium terrae]|uniref:Uncharacterized protein n=1 Tax=Longimicrobium terrae TaxID=1639882 RepID=A0A841H2B4_9BACT|nr:hypothetical protein [Longimicrobium terrae]MBB6072108.1 hypothetical protein [Longimicrobium terrae]
MGWGMDRGWIGVFGRIGGGGGVWPSPRVLRTTTLSHERMWEREHTPVWCRSDSLARRWLSGTRFIRGAIFDAVEAPNLDASAARCRGFPL